MKNIFTVSKYTFVEVYKSKILLNIILLGFALILISYIASEFSHGAQARIALDFGIGSMYLVVIGMSIFIGVSLLSNEVENRTAYMILSRPIKRWHFLTGKFLGMSSILFINVFLLGIIILAFFYFLGGSISALMWWALFFSLLESQIILLVVIFFSLIRDAATAYSTPSKCIIGSLIGWPFSFVYGSKSGLNSFGGTLTEICSEFM